jgi:rubrerythrin
MAADKAWLIVRKDISTDTDYTVFLNEHVANEAAAKSIEYIAQNELDTIGFDKEHKDMLRSILKNVKNGKWSDAVSGWEEWRDEMGPLDDDVELIEIDLVT